MADSAPDPRVNVNIRLRSSSLKRVDEIAEEHEWTRAQALRTLCRLGLKAWDEGQR
jgi:hypothetical protein